MKSDNITKKATIKKVNPNYFTGKVSLRLISVAPKPKEADVLHVKFYNGARTKIHAHTSGQMLIVTNGVGSLVTYSKGKKTPPFKVKLKKKILLHEGSIAYIPAGTLHTHGSVKKNTIFSHVAMNFSNSRNAFNTSWYESNDTGTITKKI
ncbi:MAG: cupin [Cenarchaeum symbiont of Oopsacas minuta]|nr:cupin [Cenarchaeum symbiont of Oopsacas minuta]